ncbi:MAG: 1-deoxy-D-xylulose-5-phosphate reductoisomerase [Oscillospiraceae bacterium]|nr:1-deoxy-D-xylulose-5-phosphate reductoisomerase [Oscillospiraceae bacterium]
MVRSGIDNITVLGSTGSVGVQALAVAEARGFKITALAAGSNASLLERQARKYRPKAVAIADKTAYPALKQSLADTDIAVLAGADSVCEVGAMPCGRAVNAVVGIAGLRPTLAALESGNSVALANKESLVAGGELVMSRGVLGESIFPIDSEHSAIWQCMQSSAREDVKGIILTASGGPFYGMRRDDLQNVTTQQALKHPNWDMGAKITTDCATLMNKGLEYIEAMRLFGLTHEQIEIVVHRQSIVHSAVQYNDGAVIAQLGVPDMRQAIQYALTFPRRLPVTGKHLSLTDYGSLTFAKPDLDTFICLSACLLAAKKGGLYPCIANGANEQAVSLFLSGKIGFLEIGELVMAAVEDLKIDGGCTLDAVEAADRAAREFVLTKLRSCVHSSKARNDGGFTAVPR